MRISIAVNIKVVRIFFALKPVEFSAPTANAGTSEGVLANRLYRS